MSRQNQLRSIDLSDLQYTEIVILSLFYVNPAVFCTLSARGSILSNPSARLRACVFLIPTRLVCWTGAGGHYRCVPHNLYRAIECER
jgi:hypothetical protein